MSLNTIARWNAIPLERQPEEDSHKKRPRSSHEEDEEDDDVSLVSRSPSPEAMEVDAERDLHLYDEHRDVRGVAREVITMETKIKSTNKGFALLAKMGWSEGQPLGLSGDGRVDPIPFTVKQDSTGLGKVTQEIRIIETTVSQRRELDSERMQKETEEQRKQRENNVAYKAAVKTEITNVLRPFYCDACDKQFQNVAQYDEHTNSYGHHHRVRQRDLQANHPLKQSSKEEAERRKEKERKREEKELRKMAKAAGIKIPTVSTGAGVAAPPPSTGTSISDDAAASKKSGWAKVASEPQPAASGSRWSTVATPAATPTAPRTSGGWNAVSPPAQIQSVPPPPSSNASSPANQPPSFSRGGWSTLPSSSVNDPRSKSGDNNTSERQPSRGGWSTISPSPNPTHPAPFVPPQPNAPQTPALSADVNSSSQPKVPKQPKSAVAAAAADQSRGSWQQFQKNRRR